MRAVHGQLRSSMQSRASMRPSLGWAGAGGASARTGLDSEIESVAAMPAPAARQMSTLERPRDAGATRVCWQRRAAGRATSDAIRRSARMLLELARAVMGLSVNASGSNSDCRGEQVAHRAAGEERAACQRSWAEQGQGRPVSVEQARRSARDDLARRMSACPSARHHAAQYMLRQA